MYEIMRKRNEGSLHEHRKKKRNAYGHKQSQTNSTGKPKLKNAQRSEEIRGGKREKYHTANGSRVE